MGEFWEKKGCHKIIRDICNLCDYPRVNGFWSFGAFGALVLPLACMYHMTLMRM